MKTATDILDEFKQYAYSVSHDVGAPVRSMVLFSRILSEEYCEQLDDQARDYLEHIVESGQRLQDMMTGLLSYSRLMTSTPSYTSVDVNHVVMHCLNDLDDVITQTEARFCIDSLPAVYGDVRQIHHLFSVLIDNALRYGSIGFAPRVHLYAEPAGEFWKFHVIDNGVGIPDSLKHKVFMPFSRLQGDNEGDGIGMGLTLARKIAELHGGSISHCPATPQGTDFYVLLPTGRVRV